MNRDLYYSYIDEKLHILAHRITTNGKLNMLHLHLHSENFYLHFFNLLYGYNLDNLNDVSQNVEAIDLIDYQKKVMIQVSSTSTKQKIESALNKDKLKEYVGYEFKFISIAKDATDLRGKTYKNPNSIKFDPSKDIYDIRFFLNTISSLDIEKLKKVYDFIHQELGDGNQNRFTPNILKDKYLNKFNEIKLLINSTSKPIENIYVNLAIIQDKKEEKENNKLISRDAFLSSYEEIHKPKEPIEIKDLIDTSKKSLIYGKAGIGKTTLCKYIAYKWAKDELYQEFEYVVYIPLREWKTGGIKGAIQDYYYSRDSDKLIIDIASSKMLFLFDGYDELDSDRKKLLRDEIDKYVLTHYIITTRPYGYQKNDFKIDEQFETIGFTDENVDSYIDNFFDEDNKESQSLKSYLQSNISIKHIAYIPLVLKMICSLWDKEEFSDSLTMTELYSNVIEDMLNKYSASKDDERVFKRKNRKQIKEYLGKVAFEGLIKQKILFDGDLIEDAVKDIDFFEENVIYSGFLKSDVKEKDLLDNHFEFAHLTFQEYFAALYVSKLSKKKQKNIIQKYKFYPHMKMFFIFLAGLIEDKNFFLDALFNNKGNDIIVYNGRNISILMLNCLQSMTHNELRPEKNELVEKTILKELNRTLNYPVFLKELKLISNFINDTIVVDLIEMLRDDKYRIKFKKDLIMFLFSIGRYDELIVSTFLEIIEHPEVEEDWELGKDNIISELIDLGSNQLKNIEICFGIVKKDKDFYKSIKIIEKLIKKYTDYKDTIINSAMDWLELMIEDDEKGMLQRIRYGYNNDKDFFSIIVKKLIDERNVLDLYIETLSENIEKERKFFIAIFLYFMNKSSTKVLNILIDSPLDTFNYILKYKFRLIDFIKKDIARHTNIFNTFESLLKNKQISLSFENSHKMLEKMIQDIRTEELDEKLLNFVREYYIENENIDLKHRKEIIRPSRFYLIKDSNEIIQKVVEEYYLHSFNQEQNIKIEDDISQEKNIFVWDIQKDIKERWNLDDFLNSIRYRVEYKKKVIELVTEFQFTDKNIKTLIKLMFNENIEFHFTEENIETLIALMSDESSELKVRKDITRALYENHVDNDKIFEQLTKYINETGLNFIVKANPKIESSSNMKIINALVEKLNRYYDEGERLDYFFREYGLSAFLNNEKVMNFLFKIVRHTSISSHDKKDLLFGIEYKDIPTVKILDALIGFISDREKYFHNFDWNSKYDWEVIGNLIEAIENISDIENYNIIKHLIKKSDIVPDMEESIGMNDLYSAWEKIILLLAKSPNPNIFLEDKDIPREAKKMFILASSTKDLLTSYKTEYEEMVIYIIKHLEYHNLPWYIKSDKKIYTIYEGKEISTEELNKNSLDKIPNFKKILQEKSRKKHIDIKSNIKPLIITEGKTDWKHLKKALERFQSDEFNLYQNLDIEFETFEDISMSDSELDNYAQSHAKKINSRKLICIFDRDLPERVKEYGQRKFVHVKNKQFMNTIKDKCKKVYGENSKKYLELKQKFDFSQYEEMDVALKDILTGKEYREWEIQLKNNVYAFCIPKLDDKLDEICIEFYYKDKDLKKESSDGKRLFIADEFIFKDKVNNCNRFISKCGQFKTDTQSGTNQTRHVTLQYPNKKERGYVYRIEDEECSKLNNMNLSKNDFAKNIEYGVEGFHDFDIENFKLIFDVIEKIIND